MNHLFESSTSLPVSNDEDLEYDCILTMEWVFPSRPDLKNIPLEDLEWILFALSREQPSGYTVVTLENVSESQPLPSNTSAQKAELLFL